MKEKVTLNVKEQKRLLILNEMMAGRMIGQEAAEMLGLSLRLCYSPNLTLQRFASDDVFGP